MVARWFSELEKSLNGAVSEKLLGRVRQNFRKLEIYQYENCGELIESLVAEEQVSDSALTDIERFIVELDRALIHSKLTKDICAKVAWITLELVNRDYNFPKCSSEKLTMLDMETRGVLFECISQIEAVCDWEINIALSARSPWNGAKETKSNCPLNRFMEDLRRKLIIGGFSLSQDRVVHLLDLFGRDAAPVSLLDAYESQYTQQNISIFKDVAKAIQKGDIELSQRDRLNGKRILEMAFTNYSGQVEPGLHITDALVIKALRTIAGTGEQDTFFERMSAIAPCHIPNIPLNSNWEKLAPIFDAALNEAHKIFKEVIEYQEGDKTSVHWLNNKSEFEAQFGPPCSDDPRTVYGWWHRVTNGEKAFRTSHRCANSDNQLSNFLLGKSKFMSAPVSLKSAMYYRQQLIEQAPTWPWNFGNRGLAATSIFSFGSNGKGELLNQLASLGSGKPTKTWRQKTADRISENGSKITFAVFEAWLAEFFRDTAPTIPLHLFYNMTLQASAFCNEGLTEEAKQTSIPRPISLELERAQKLNGAARDQKIRFIGLLLAAGFYRCTRESLHTSTSSFYEERLYKLSGNISDNNDLVLRAIICAMLEFPAEKTIPLVLRVADSLLNGQQDKIRSKRALSSCLWMLGQVGSEQAAHAVGCIRRRLQDKNLIKQADKALAELGTELGIPADEMLEMAMPDYGIDESGSRVIEKEGLRVELRLVSASKAVITTTDSDGKIIRGVSKRFKSIDGMAEVATELESAAKDIAKVLPEARHRIESSWRDGRTWQFGNWKRLLAQNGLLYSVVSKLVWVVETKNGLTSVLWQDGSFTDCYGKRVAEPEPNSRVYLWHPSKVDAEETSLWRELLSASNIRQPFVQVWRPVYVVTEAERQTEVYSNRFSAHVLEQSPVMAMLKKRGWIAFNRTMQGNSAKHERVQIILPHYGIAAQFWVAGVGNRIQEGRAAEAGGQLYAFIATDRLCFLRLNSESNQPEDSPIHLDDVPELALCEVMYDIDHVIGRTSIGMDRRWSDRGAFASYPKNEQSTFEQYRERYSAGVTSGLAKSRREYLRKLIPALEIADQLEIADDFLIVDGKLNTYQINYGSGNILIAPNDKYLCIIPAASEKVPVALPYEGDQILSIILSKAFLLAADEKIGDQTILSQIR